MINRQLLFSGIPLIFHGDILVFAGNVGNGENQTGP